MDYLRSKLTDKQFQLLFKSLAITVGVVTVVVGGALTAMDSIHTLSIQVLHAVLEEYINYLIFRSLVLNFVGRSSYLSILD